MKANNNGYIAVKMEYYKFPGLNYVFSIAKTEAFYCLKCFLSFFFCFSFFLSFLPIQKHIKSKLTTWLEWYFHTVFKFSSEKELLGIHIHYCNCTHIHYSNCFSVRFDNIILLISVASYAVFFWYARNYVE